jgi:hypothetical protein
MSLCLGTLETDSLHTYSTDETEATSLDQKDLVFRKTYSYD